MGSRRRRHGVPALTEPMTPDALEAALRKIGETRYPQPTPVPPPAARRPAHPRPGAGLGAQPLLLPEPHPGQGRRPAGAAAHAGTAPRMAAAAGGPRRNRNRRGRRAPLVQAGRRRRPGCRPGGKRRRDPAGDAFRRGRLCALRQRALGAGGHRLVPDRDVLADHHRRARVRHAGQLRLDQPGHPRLFHPPADPGAAGYGVRPGLCEGPRRHGRKSSSRCWRPCASSATCCGRSWTRCISPMSSQACRRRAAFQPQVGAA